MKYDPEYTYQENMDVDEEDENGWGDEYGDQDVQ